MEPAIVVDRVGKRFRRYHTDRPATIQEFVAKALRRRRSVEWFWGLHDVSFSVSPGKTVGIIGSNGSGKSTLLRLIGGVGRPDSGRIEVRGRLGGLLDLAAGFHPDLSGRENALLAGILNGLTRREVLDKLDSIVAFAEVEDAIDSPTRTYSSGMQMRLAFAVAVHTEPEVLLIDEVLAVGDIRFQRKCLDKIEEFKRKGASILMVSHVGRLIESLCDEAVWLDRGVLVAQGPAAAVAGQYRQHVSQQRDEDEQADGSGSYPTPSSATRPIGVTGPGGTRLNPDSERFGSMELVFDGARLLDAQGGEVQEIAAGRAVTIELKYSVFNPVTAPIFGVGISRDDGLLICTFDSESLTATKKLSVGGSILLQIDRLDLNSGVYTVTAACYAHTWDNMIDYQPAICSFVVPAGGPKHALLNVPCRWDLRPTAGLDAEPAGGITRP